MAQVRGSSVTLTPSTTGEQAAAGPGGAPADQVVLLDDAGTAIGTADRIGSHDERTPLHLAFSLHLLDDAGRTLLTRRAATKRTWPGVWTNSFCGHPGPGEEPADAVVRRSVQELGIEVEGVTSLLPSFRYRAVMADGTVENEVCPVFTARIATGSGDLVPDPDEVDEFRWVHLDELREQLAADPSPFSPWMLWQWEQFPR